MSAASDVGIPVPRVVSAQGRDLVLELLPGPTLLPQGLSGVCNSEDCHASGHSLRRHTDEPTEPWRIVTNTRFDATRHFTHYIRPGDVQIATDDASKQSRELAA